MGVEHTIHLYFFIPGCYVGLSGWHNFKIMLFSKVFKANQHFGLGLQKAYLFFNGGQERTL